MRCSGNSIFLSTVIPIVFAAEAPRPRGVSPDLAKFFKSLESFTCISNPSVKLSYSQINDDYCDCPDGSDEPGTSACSYLSHVSPSITSDTAIENINSTLALPGFYCENKGHQPGYVPFLSVNDGVCDYDVCCDGSDEWEHVGGRACEDKCKEIGKEWKKQNEQRQRSLGIAIKKRKELVTEARKLRKEVEDQLQNLRIQIEGSEIKVRELEKELEDVERKERGKVVRTPGQGSRTSVLASLAKERIEELREALISVREERDISRERTKELEKILSTFQEEYNPNFNDEGVKRAVRSWEDYAAKGKSLEENAAFDRDLDEITKSDSETGAIQWEEWERQEESDTDVLYKFEEYLPDSLRGWVDQKLRDLRILLIENGLLAGSTNLGTEPQSITDARNALKLAQDSLNSIHSQLTGHKNDLEKGYGPDDVFRALKGQCISKDSGEYTYELCWLDRTKQKSKKGGSDTLMGSFTHLDHIVVDDEVVSDGKGLGSGERIVMKFENGQHCWNGPHRSTMVVLGCAEKDEIWKISEEEKCVYRMEVGTPAVCESVGSAKAKAHDKEEL